MLPKNTTYGNEKYSNPRLNLIAGFQGQLREPYGVNDVVFTTYFGFNDIGLSRRFVVKDYIKDYDSFGHASVFLEEVGGLGLKLNRIAAAYCFPAYEEDHLAIHEYNKKCPSCGAPAYIYSNGSYDCSEGC